MLSNYLNLEKINIVHHERMGHYPKACDRKAWESLPEETKKKLVQEAEPYLNYQYPSLLASDFMKFTTENTRWAYTTPYHDRRDVLCKLVLAECVEHQGRFMMDIMNGIYLICEETTWVGNAHMALDAGKGARIALPTKKTGYVDLYAGYTASTMSWLYYILKDELDFIDPLICDTLLTEIRDRILEPFLNEYMYWMTSGNNWGPDMDMHVLTTAYLTVDDDAYLEKILRKILWCANSYFADYPDDGACVEGANYWIGNCSIGKVLDLIRYMTGGEINGFRSDKFHKMLRFGLDLYAGNGNYAVFSDSALKKGGSAEFVYQCGKQFDDEDLMIFGAKRNNVENAIGGWAGNLFTVYSKLFPNAAAAKEMEEYAKKETHFPLRSYYQSSGNLFLRETEGEKGLFFSIVGGCNDVPHNHNDIGTFNLFRDTEPVIVDAGMGDYSRNAFLKDVRYTIWPFRSAYHNVPLIGGVEQKFGKQYAAANVIQEDDSITMDLAPAYGDPRIRHWIRAASYAREEGIIRITENYDLTEEMPIALNFLLCEAPDIQEKQVVLSHNVAICHDGTLQVSYRKLDKECAEYPVHGWSMHGYELYMLTFATAGKEGTIRYSIETN